VLGTDLAEPGAEWDSVLIGASDCGAGGLEECPRLARSLRMGQAASLKCVWLRRSLAQCAAVCS